MYTKRKKKYSNRYNDQTALFFLNYMLISIWDCGVYNHGNIFWEEVAIIVASDDLMIAYNR